MLTFTLSERIYISGGLNTDYKKSYIILKMGVIFGAIVVFIGLSIGTKIPLLGSLVGVIGLIGMLVGIGQAFFYYKCPSCTRQFNIRGKNPDHCPGCGCKLDW